MEDFVETQIILKKSLNLWDEKNNPSKCEVCGEKSSTCRQTGATDPAIPGWAAKDWMRPRVHGLAQGLHMTCGRSNILPVPGSVGLGLLG